MFKQLHLFEIIYELASENVNSYIYTVHIHEYIQTKFQTCTCEVGDPILLQNIDRKYVVPKAKQEKKMRRNMYRCFKNYDIICFRLMCTQKSHMAHAYAGYHSLARTNFLNWHNNTHTKHAVSIEE